MAVLAALVLAAAWVGPAVAQEGRARLEQELTAKLKAFPGFAKLPEAAERFLHGDFFEHADGLAFDGNGLDTELGFFIILAEPVHEFVAGRDPSLAGGGEAAMKYHSAGDCALTRDMRGPWLVGSLSGADASQMVTEARNGSLRWDGNPPLSAKAHGSLTARQTGRAETKVGLSDPTAPSGRAVAYRIKATPGITG